MELALAISSGCLRRIGEMTSHAAFLPRQPAFQMDSFRAVLGSEEWRLLSIRALIQIKHPTSRRRIHWGRRQRPLAGYEQSDAMGVRTTVRGVKECIYLNETQRAENERAMVSRDLTEAATAFKHNFEARFASDDISPLRGKLRHAASSVL